MSEIITKIIINAHIVDVWQALIDFPAYEKWNPFIRNIKGSARVNEQLVVNIAPPGKKAITFKPKIISLIPQRELKWRGHLLIPGIFDGVHQFQLNEQANNRVQFIHSEYFSGFLKGPIFKMIGTATEQGFEKMNAAFKEYCEARV